MTSRFTTCIMAAIVLTGTPSLAQQSTSSHVAATLVAEHTSIVPGKPFNVALRLLMEPEWHTYWKNPGDAGLATTIEWKLPEGFSAGEIRWPSPHKFGEPPEISYGYNDTVLLPVEITPPSTLRPGETIVIEAKAAWLSCRQMCLKGKADVMLRLPVASGDGEGNSAWAEEFAKTFARIPRQPSASELTVSARREKEGTGYLLRVEVRDDLIIIPLSLAFFAGEESVIDHSTEQPLEQGGNYVQLSLPVSPYATEQPERLRGVLVFNGSYSVEIDVPITEY